MNKFICDDRLDMEELIKKISSMPDEEFEKHLDECKEEEEQSTNCK